MYIFKILVVYMKSTNFLMNHHYIDWYRQDLNKYNKDYVFLCLGKDIMLTYILEQYIFKSQESAN